MPLFRKRPVDVEAVQFTGNNWTESLDFLRTSTDDQNFASVDGVLSVCTREGDMKVSPGDWIVKGVKGEMYPCKPDIFVLLHDPVESTD